MPLSKKGTKIMNAMRKQYGPVKGKKVFYATKNAGKISGVEKSFYGHVLPSHFKSTDIITTKGR